MTDEKKQPDAPPERTWTEAPASCTIRFNLQGFDCMFTLRGETGKAVLPKVEQAIGWLQKKGAEPTHSNGAGSGNGGEPETKVCPIHHVVMKRRSGRGGDSWYSHKAINPDTGQEYWCRGEQKD